LGFPREEGGNRKKGTGAKANLSERFFCGWVGGVRFGGEKTSHGWDLEGTKTNGAVMGRGL